MIPILAHYKRTLTTLVYFDITIWGKIFKNGLSEICGRQPLADHITSKFLKAVSHRFCLVHF